jgi:polysaccharide pyruvyl transferase WcaK-like protein
MSTSPTIHIGIVFGSLFNGNLGVQALTYSLISLLESAGERYGFNCQYTLFESMQSAESGNLQLAGKVVPFSVVRFHGFGKKLWFGENAKKFLEHSRELDVMFDIGGGDSFSDIYGVQRFASLCLTKQQLKKIGVPVVMPPQTIGPFKHGWVRLAANRTMTRVTSVYSRDQMSTDYLQKHLPGMATQEFVDMAFFLPFETPEVASAKPRVGLNVSGLLYSGGYTKNNQFQLHSNYPDTIHQLIEAIKQDPSLELHLVPHVIAPSVPVEDDLAVCRELARRYDLPEPHQFNSPIEAKSFIAGLDFFLGARMHSTIAAFSSGVPVLPMAYSRKFNGLFLQSLDYPHMVDLKTQNSEEIVSAALECLKQRTEIREQMNLTLNRIRKQRDTLIDSFANDIARSTNKIAL